MFCCLLEFVLFTQWLCLHSLSLDSPAISSHTAAVQSREQEAETCPHSGCAVWHTMQVTARLSSRSAMPFSTSLYLRPSWDGEAPLPAGTDICQVPLSLNILVSCWSRCLLVPVEVERHVVNDVLVVHCDAAGHRHGRRHLVSYLLLQNLQNVTRGGAVVFSLVICIIMYQLSLLLNFIIGMKKINCLFLFSHVRPKPPQASVCFTLYGGVESVWQIWLSRDSNSYLTL